MHAPIAKLNNTHETLEKELKGLQERESCAKAEAEHISNQMEQLKAEAEGILQKHGVCFSVVFDKDASGVGCVQSPPAHFVCSRLRRVGAAARTAHKCRRLICQPAYAVVLQTSQHDYVFSPNKCLMVSVVHFQIIETEE